MGVKVTFHDEIPWKRQLAAVFSGEFDALSTINFSEERNKKYLLSDPIHSFPVRAFKLKNRKIEFEKTSELIQFRGAYSRGSYYGPDFEKLKDNNPNLYSINGTRNIIKLLLNERVDFLVSPSHLAIKLIKEEGADKDIGVFGPIIHKQNVHLAFSREFKCPEIIEQYNAILKSLKETDFLEKLNSKYW